MMRSSRSGGTVVIVAVAMLGWLMAVSARADDMALTQGKALYMKNCAPCHGDGGKGDGPKGAALTPKPTDLTQIAKGNGGKFPFYETMMLINGRSPMGQDQDASIPGIVPPSAHGTAAMPAWGEVFSREELSKGSSLDLQLQATGKIMLITEYVQSLQQK